MVVEGLKRRKIVDAPGWGRQLHHQIIDIMISTVVNFTNDKKKFKI